MDCLQSAMRQSAAVLHSADDTQQTILMVFPFWMVHRDQCRPLRKPAQRCNPARSWYR